MQRLITIDARFRGPPDSANGGYACGLLAEVIEGVATARLRVPPPLDRPMSIQGDGSFSRLLDGEVVVGEATSDELELSVPPPPTLDIAKEAVASYAGFEYHPFPTCYVCGPTREPGDGLQIFPGPVPGTDLVASPWTPDATLTDEDGEVDRRHMWAALDCPSYFGISHAPPAVLASLTADISRVPEIGEPLVAFGWHRRSEGRKHHSGSAIATQEGEIIGKASALWIEPKAGMPV